LKLLGEDDLRIMIQQINSMYDTGEWPKDFSEVTMIALKKKPEVATIAYSASLHIQQR